MKSFLKLAEFKLTKVCLFYFEDSTNLLSDTGATLEGLVGDVAKAALQMFAISPAKNGGAG